MKLSCPDEGGAAPMRMKIEPGLFVSRSGAIYRTKEEIFK